MTPTQFATFVTLLKNRADTLGLTGDARNIFFVLAILRFLPADISQPGTPE